MEKQADLRKWFKEKWVDISRKNPDGSHPECGRDEAKLGKKGYPKCRPKAKAAQMTKKEKSYAVRAKRSKRQGVGGKPTMVPTEKPDRKSMKKEASILEKLAFSESTRDAKNTLTSAQLDKEDPEFAVSGVSKKNALRGMGHNLSREDMATVKNTDASPKYMDAGGTSSRARLKTWRKTMKGNKKNFFARRRVLKQVKSNTDEPSIIAIKKDGTRHLVAGNSRASLRSALGMPIKAHVFHDVEQTKTAMNLYQHFEAGLEKAAKYIKGKPGRANIISRNKHQIASTVLTGVPQIALTLAASDGDMAGGVIGPSLGSRIRDISNEDRRRGYHHHKKVVDSHMRTLDTKGAQGKSAPAAKLRERLQSATSDEHKEKILDKAMKKTHRHALRSHALHAEADDFKARFQAFGDNKRIKKRLSKMRTKARETGATAKHFHSVANQAAKSISRQHMAANLVKRKNLQG